MKNLAICIKCKNMVFHKHVHDTAYGMPQTHMANSERFECTDCGHITFVNDPGAENFVFVLDHPLVKKKELNK